MEPRMTSSDDTGNLLFQSENHPLVPLEFDSCEGYCLSLIYRKAYLRAAEMAVGSDVLDLGCNNGYGTRTIAQRCRRIVGIDVSVQAIEAASSTHAEPNIEYRVVDGGSLPFKDRSFDLVSSFQVIEHVDHVEPYLHEIRRVLRDEGKVVFTTPNRCIRLDPGQRPWNPFHVREYDAVTLEQTLREVFPYVVVEGLFASPDLYRIERDRAARAKAATRPSRAARLIRTLLGISAGNVAIERIKAITPARLVRCLRSTGNRSSANSTDEVDSEILPAFINRWSPSDLYYGDDDLDQALDLIAICSISDSVLDRQAH
jgi:SAM-dependent methyltransferase